MIQRSVSGILIAAALIASADLQAQDTSAITHKAKLHKGRGVKLATVAPLSSATAKEGQEIKLRVAQPATFGSIILLSEGEIVSGRIAKVKRAKSNCSDGEITLEVKSLTFHGASSVHSKVQFVNPDPAYAVPADLPDSRISPYAWSFLGPFMTVTAPIWGPLAIGEAIERRCSGLGNDLILPAGSTVAVSTLGDVEIQYTGNLLERGT